MLKKTWHAIRTKDGGKHWQYYHNKIGRWYKAGNLANMSPEDAQKMAAKWIYGCYANDVEIVIIQPARS